MRKTSILLLLITLCSCSSSFGKVDGKYKCDMHFYSSVFNQEKNISSTLELKTISESVVNATLANEIDTLNFQCKYKVNGKSVLLWIIPKTDDDIQILSNDDTKHDAVITDNRLNMTVKKSTLIYDDASPYPVEWISIYKLKGTKIK